MARDIEPWRDEVPMDYPRTIQFHIGASRVYATATLFHRLFPLVLRLSIQPRPWYSAARTIVSCLPRFLQALIKRWFPGPFLPGKVVLKQLATEEERYTHYFDNEIRVYEKLQHLQGDVIPVFYGKATCENRRAMVLSLVEGPTGLQQTNPIPLDEFKKRFEIAHTQLQNMGMGYDDTKLDNVILTDDGRIVLIDLEGVYEPASERLDEACSLIVGSFMEQYRDYLRNREREKLDQW